MSWIFISLLATPSAQAYECIDFDGPGGFCGCYFAPGNSLTYHVVASDFTADEETAIQKGANAWDAGQGKVNRGADWDFIRGSDITGWSRANLRNDVAMETDGWFANEMAPLSAMAVATHTYFLCWASEVDILFRASEDWMPQLPAFNDADVTEPSIGMVAIHEFGHALGWEHEDDVISVMDSFYPFGGDISYAYRISENDYLGLLNEKADSSTGLNLLLSKFSSTGRGSSREEWTAASRGTETWSGCPGECLTGDERPNPVMAMYMGTDAKVDTEVRWSLSTDVHCLDADDRIVGTRGMRLAVNEPTNVYLNNFCIPSSTPPGNYRVCAVIDPDNDISEPSGADNQVVSDLTFEVESCP
ncbi:MAG: matrixin family metalloprotease [Myxococcota bacterium]